jgi:SRSO17 transposase
VGGGRHRLPQRRHLFGGGAAPVLGHAGQDGQLPAGRVSQRRGRAGQLPVGLAAVYARGLGRGRHGGAAGGLPGARLGAAPAKWQLALDMVDELAVWGLVPPVLVSDAGYGEVGEFRQGLDDRQIPYVVQVKADTSAYPEPVRPTTAPYRGRGRRPQPRYRDKPTSLKGLALAAGQPAWVELIWRRGSKGLQCSRFPALGVRPAGVTPRRQAARHSDGELPVRWLLAEWPTDKPEPTKYWLSNLPATTPMGELVRLGKLRWRIEMCQPQCTHICGLAA